LKTSAITAGLGDSAVAYGYAMTGASALACVSSTAQGLLVVSSIFYGAKY